MSTSEMTYIKANWTHWLATEKVKGKPRYYQSIKNYKALQHTQNIFRNNTYAVKMVSNDWSTCWKILPKLQGPIYCEQALRRFNEQGPVSYTLHVYPHKVAKHSNLYAYQKQKVTSQTTLSHVQFCLVFGSFLLSRHLFSIIFFPSSSGIGPRTFLRASTCSLDGFK